MASYSPGPAGVAVETALIRLQAGVLHYRFARRMLADGERPDDAALHISRARPGAVCHSTSWRYEDGGVVLTYAVVPDPHPAREAVALVAPSVMCSGDPLRPAPDDVHDHHVAAHAVRHLAYLAGTDPAVAAVAEDDRSGCWSAIRTVGAVTPVAVHEAAHQPADHAPAHDSARPRASAAT